MESYLARPKERPRRKMTTLSYSLVVFRVKKSETGKVKTTTRKESSSRMRERPFEDGDDSNADQDSKDCSDDDDTEERKDDRPASAGSGSGGLFAILPILKSSGSWPIHTKTYPLGPHPIQGPRFIPAGWPLGGSAFALCSCAIAASSRSSPPPPQPPLSP